MPKLEPIHASANAEALGQHCYEASRAAKQQATHVAKKSAGAFAPADELPSKKMKIDEFE